MITAPVDGLELLTIEEASELLKLKISRIRKAIFKREVKYIKLGALIRFKKDHLTEWIESRTVSAAKR